MKKNVQILLGSIFLVILSTKISFAQCGDDNSWSGLYITPDTVGTTKTLTFNTGQYALAYVTPNSYYTVYTCGNASFDTQLTIYDASGAFIAYNDDFCGIQSSVSFIAPSCGYVKILLDQYFCQNSGIPMSVSMIQNSGAAAAPNVKVNTVPSLTLCEGDSVLLYGTSKGNDVSYTWSTGFADSSYIIPTPGIYYVVTGADANGCSMLDSIAFTVNPLPTVTANSPIPTTICLKDTVFLYGDGTANVTYAWTGGITDSTTFTPAASGTFDYVVTGTEQSTLCKNKDTIRITVNALPAVSAVSTTGSAVFCAKDSATFYGTGAGSYTWTGGITDNTKFLVTAGRYVVTGTDANGCVNKDSLDLLVNALPTVGAATTASRICAGEEITLQGTGAVSYTWSGSVTDNLPFAPLNTGIYKVLGTDANGCSDTTSIMITVDPLPAVTANSSTAAFCPGEGVTLYGGGAVSYVWSGGVDDNVEFNPAATGTYTVTGTGANGCDNTASITITLKNLPDVTTTVSGITINVAATGASYQWLQQCGTGDSPISGATNQSYTALVSGSYSVKVTVNGCVDTSACVPLTVTGLQNAEEATAFTIYPNPNAGAFTIRSSTEGAYKLVNELGQTVATFTLSNSNEYSMNFEELKAGIYTIVGTNKDKAINKRIVVSR